MTGATDLITLDYTERDHEIVDYQNFSLPGIERVLLRGPAPDLDGPWFSCIGAAQTQGIFVQRPFPELIAERIGLDDLNLGIGGAWAGLFVDSCPDLIDWANRGRFVVLQAMSARGGRTSRFTPTGKVERLRDEVVGDIVPAIGAWERVLTEGVDTAKEYVAEVRQSWIESNLALIERLEQPVVFLWFSKRTPDVEPVYSLDGDLFTNMGEFPHYVDRASLETVAAACAGYCECLSTRNTGHRLVSRFTGEPVATDHAALTAQRAQPGQPRPTESPYGLSPTHNTYYPSPEMHEDAADALMATLRELDLV